MSKKYLPHMAAGFDDPRVTVHIGDGFKWLADKKGQYDVIITDSSDPVGPANSLFEKPYFVLLEEALRPGGHISTQGECIWLHLPLISKVLSTMKSLFPTVNYAYTSIPTYPSGTIGFVICSKDGTHNLKKALRKVENCRYYNAEVHQASFVMPSFARDVVEAAKPEHGSTSSTLRPKKVLLLGSGFVALPCAEYVLRRSENSLTVGPYPHHDPFIKSVLGLSNTKYSFIETRECPKPGFSIIPSSWSSVCGRLGSGCSRQYH